jgi:hypothetical protein
MRPIFGLFLWFVAKAFGEELVHEGHFQLHGGLNDQHLRFDRPLHCRKDVRDLLLLGRGIPASLIGSSASCDLLIALKIAPD